MSALDLSNRSILVVDDVKFSRTTLSSMLGQMGSPEISIAANGREAIELLYSQGGVDLIISDFNMPLMHGLQLLHAVRTGEKGIRRGMPFAMVTGYSEKYLVDSALSLDVNAILIKPVSKQGLERRLLRMLEQSSTDSWLKPLAHYKKIQVDDALKLNKEAGDEPSSAKGVTLVTDMTPKPKPPGDKFAEEEIRGCGSARQDDTKAPETSNAAQSGGAKADVKNAEECSILNVPENAILAQNIYTSDGRRYLDAGEVLTPRLISILVDLHDLGHPVENIWVSK